MKEVTMMWQLAVISVFAALYHADAGNGAVLNSSGRIRTGPSIAAVITIVLGLIVCFYGYRLFRPAVFVCGFLAGGLLVALIIEYAFAAMAWVAVASWIGFLIGGFICGILVLLLYHVGVFIVGAVAGALLAFMLNTSFLYKLYPSQPDIMLVIAIIVLALICGALAWKLERPIIILATSFIGADAFVWGIGYFAGKYPSGADLKQFRFRDPTGDWVYSIPGAWWAYLTATLLLFIVGVVVQFRKTASGIRHTRPQNPPSAPPYQTMGTPRDGASHV